MDYASSSRKVIRSLVDFHTLFCFFTFSSYLFPSSTLLVLPYPPYRRRRLRCRPFFPIVTASPTIVQSTVGGREGGRGEMGGKN